MEKIDLINKFPELCKEIFESRNFYTKVVTWSDYVKSITPPKEWQITSFKGFYNSLIFSIQKDENYSNVIGGCSFDLNSMLHDNGCVDSKYYEIHSVLRLSDNQEFKLGDKTEKGVIEKFIIDRNTLIVRTNDGFNFSISEI